jgi:hypothetical protein
MSAIEMGVVSRDGTASATGGGPPDECSFQSLDAVKTARRRVTESCVGGVDLGKHGIKAAS